MKTIIFILLPLSLAITGCEQQYRYPCQDPNNWNNPECKKPLCEVNKDCPEYIFKDEQIKAAPRLPAATKGDCK